MQCREFKQKSLSNSTTCIIIAYKCIKVTAEGYPRGPCTPLTVEGVQLNLVRSVVLLLHPPPPPSLIDFLPSLEVIQSIGDNTRIGVGRWVPQIRMLKCLQRKRIRIRCVLTNSAVYNSVSFSRYKLHRFRKMSRGYYTPTVFHEL